MHKTLIMMSQSFNKYESLPLLVMLLLEKSVASGADEPRDLDDDTMREVAARLWENETDIPFLEEILKLISAGNFVTPETYEQDKINRENFSKIFLESVGFFRWAESRGYQLPFRVKQNVERKEIERRLSHFADYKITPAQVAEKLKEPLWYNYHAIMYLHGFAPPKVTYSSFQYGHLFQIFLNHEGMMEVMRYLRDAEAAGDIQVFPDDRFNGRVKPKEFMAWAKSLDMDFPNLIFPDTTQPMSKPPRDQLHTKEKATLLKLLLGLALTNYTYNPLASSNSTAKEIASDLELQGLRLDEDTVRKWLNEAKEYLPDNWEPQR